MEHSNTRADRQAAAASPPAQGRVPRAGIHAWAKIEHQFFGGRVRGVQPLDEAKVGAWATSWTRALFDAGASFFDSLLSVLNLQSKTHYLLYPHTRIHHTLKSLKIVERAQEHSSLRSHCRIGFDCTTRWFYSLWSLFLTSYPIHLAHILPDKHQRMEWRPRQKPIRVGHRAGNQAKSPRIRTAPGARVEHGSRRERARVVGRQFRFYDIDLDLVRAWRFKFASAFLNFAREFSLNFCARGLPFFVFLNTFYNFTLVIWRAACGAMISFVFNFFKLFGVIVMCGA